MWDGIGVQSSPYLYTHVEVLVGAVLPAAQHGGCCLRVTQGQQRPSCILPHVRACIVQPRRQQRDGLPTEQCPNSVTGGAPYQQVRIVQPRHERRYGVPITQVPKSATCCLTHVGIRIGQVVQQRVDQGRIGMACKRLDYPDGRSTARETLQQRRRDSWIINVNQKAERSLLHRTIRMIEAPDQLLHMVGRCCGSLQKRAPPWQWSCSTCCAIALRIRVPHPQGSGTVPVTDRRPPISDDPDIAEGVAPDANAILDGAADNTDTR
jgi:hypothetical protein